MLPRLPVGKMFHATALLLAMSWPAFSQPSPAPSLTGDALGGNVKPVVIVPDAGHSVWEPPVRAAMLREVEDAKARLRNG